MAGYRPPYTRNEEQTILRYILDEQAHYRLRGDALWKELAESGQVSRTWQSLKQHFRKHMVFKLNSRIYNLTDDERFALKKAYNDTNRDRDTLTQTDDDDDDADSDVEVEVEPSATRKNASKSTPKKATRNKPSTSVPEKSQADPKKKKLKTANESDKQQMDFFAMKFSDDDE